MFLPTLIQSLRKAFGLAGRPVIMGYRGYGNAHQVHVQGHVLDDRLLYEAKQEDRKRKNAVAMLSRYVSKALPRKRVKIHFANREFVVQSDAAGYFSAELAFPEPLAMEGWQPVRYELLDQPASGETVPVTESSVYLREQNSTFGVISDVDDTILVSHASKIWHKLYLILTKNAKTRLPFTGVAAFYHALRAGVGAGCCNPIFYVSSSEWNLYDFLVDFCEQRGIPRGPFLLQKHKQSLWEILRSGGGSHTHKLAKIRHILSTYPALNFLLIGDSGQQDGPLYAEVVREFPGRILAIYIRDVTASGAKEELLANLAEAVGKQGVDMLLVPDTAAAARHACAQGWITEAACRRVAQEVARRANNGVK
jgi:phosphatidate phosphatase APP1